MKNTILIPLLTFAIGFGVSWFLKSGNETGEAVVEPKISKATQSSTPRSVVRPERAEEEVVRPERVDLQSLSAEGAVRVLNLNGRDLPTREERLARTKKRVMSREAKKLDKRLAKLVESLGLTPAQAEALGKRFDAALEKMDADWDHLHGKNRADLENMDEIKEYVGYKNGGAELEALAGVLNADQLAAYEEQEVRARQNLIDSRALKDLAELTFLDLDAEQKNKIYENLYNRANERLSNPSDEVLRRAFLSETRGQTIQPSAFLQEQRNRANSIVLDTSTALEAGGQLNIESIVNTIASQQQQVVDSKVDLISEVLNEDQEASYREHLRGQNGGLQVLPGSGGNNSLQFQISED